MASLPKKARDILEFLALFALLYIVSQFALRQYFPATFAPDTLPQGVTISAVDATVKGGHHPILVVQNYSGSTVNIDDKCPESPVEISFMTERGFEPRSSSENAVPCEVVAAVESGKKEQIDLAPWKYSLFSDYGQYQAALTFDYEGKSETVVTTFSIHEEGGITKIFRTFVSKPLLNLLIFIASVDPNHSLAFAIILLTLLVKIALYFPTQHGLEGQKRMQAIQPRLNAVKLKFKDDPQRMQKETMKIWKEEKINPFQSCMPILIQFPILIGLFYVIRDGSVLELSRHLLYEMHANLDWVFNTNFFGLDLLEPSRFILPPLLMISQFTQMKLSFAMAEKKNPTKKKPESKEKASQQQMQQKMMLYGLPLMIGVFALQFPAAVSLYWGVSTFFAIGQQIVVNRKTA